LDWSKNFNIVSFLTGDTVNLSSIGNSLHH
jgi:hypothetical protein